MCTCSWQLKLTTAKTARNKGEHKQGQRKKDETIIRPKKTAFKEKCIKRKEVYENDKTLQV